MANALEPRRVVDDTGPEQSHKSAGMNARQPGQMPGTGTALRRNNDIEIFFSELSSRLFWCPASLYMYGLSSSDLYQVVVTELVLRLSHFLKCT